MDAERWARIKTLFGDALDLPAEQRRALLAREAANDAALIEEVETLLAAHSMPGEFLESMPEKLRVAAFEDPLNTNRVGERIGAYRIAGVLGSGGMGDVYRAVRDDDQYHAEVAIKFMRADVRNPLALQRFKNERQILASLDHRNIARLLDGGTTEAGLPYVVMELISGEPVDRYCSGHGLPVRERVKLFLQVCAAVSYAHQHLVVHRDLKPNNILVTADGSVKLLDFGIAKLLETNGMTLEADATVTQLRAMTLEYASPEQVSGGLVTTVSDVYSLGVVLYRLLTGQSPYRERGNDAQRMAEILGDTAPTRPSLVQTAARREIDADLDNILLMALRKEPQRRYGSVEQFAGDLRNYLNGLPVQARGNARRYRLGKFLRRRKVELAAAAIVIASLIGGLGFALREARIAEQQRVIAQRHFDSVRKLSNTMLFDIHGEVDKLAGSTRAREVLVKTSLEYLDALYQESGDDAKLREELALAYKKVGDIQGSELQSNLGDRKGAKESYARAAALLEALIAADPKNSHAAQSLATTYLQQVRFVMNTDGTAAALPLIQKTVALNETLQDTFTDDYARLGQLGDAFMAQALVLNSVGRDPEAMAALDKMMAVAEWYARTHPTDNNSYLTLSAAYSNASLISDSSWPRAERIERSISLLRKAEAANRKLLELRPDSGRYLYAWTETRANLGDILYIAAQYPQALEKYRQAYEYFSTGKDDPNDARDQWARALIEVGMAKSLAKLGKVDEAEALFTRSEKSLQAMMAKGGDTLGIMYGLAALGIRRGEMYMVLAANPRMAAAERAQYWRRARDSLAAGTAFVHKVDAASPFTGVERELLIEGDASLARAEAEVGILSGARTR